MRRALLLILDGAGYSTGSHGNAVTAEHMPGLFECMDRHGFAVLHAAGEAVGLEPGQVGNSEAGHMTIGAGHTVPSLARRILGAYEDGSWLDDPGWEIARQNGILHVVGLVSDAGVHATARTIFHVADLAARAGVARIVVHPVLDGVDSKAGTAPELLSELRERLASVPRLRYGVIQGRRAFCDRSGDLDVSREVAAALRGEVELPLFSDGRLTAHVKQTSEAEFAPHWMETELSAIAPDEPVVLTSHRADRARQIATVLGETQPVLMLVDPGRDVNCEHVFFPQQPLKRGLAFEFRRAGLRSRRIAEKCKFPHVTFFFNGFDAGVEGDGVCIPSLPEAEIRAHPEMSASRITDAIVEALRSPGERVLVANLANLDQVGHLGNYELAIHAAHQVEVELRRIAGCCEENGWTLLITGDHGNADQVVDADGSPHGSHTDRPVPLAVQPAPGLRARWVGASGTLANVAASMLAALDLDVPGWMHPPLVRFESAAS